jgi:8-amino-7-oxononanoate synthase
LRARAPAAGLDFASNDYLGLAGSELLKQAALDALNRGVPVGAAGSRLLRGNHPEHEALEQEAAAFFGAEAALFIGGGFQANHALFSALPMQGDLILYDALIHASAHDGMRLGRTETRAFAHNDVVAAEAEILSWRAEGGTGRLWLAVESLYSMEGDLAPLDQLRALARRHDAVLVVDEAHATVLFGPTGAGRALVQPHDPTLLTLHTCGKGLGAVGALICGDAALIETLVNKARPFIFATAPSPLNAAVVRASLRALHDAPTSASSPAYRDPASERSGGAAPALRSAGRLSPWRCRDPALAGRPRPGHLGLHDPVDRRSPGPDPAPMRSRAGRRLAGPVGLRPRPLPRASGLGQSGRRSLPADSRRHGRSAADRLDRA